eukprot:1463875-Heterocapsa_arctica.AAC.1
MRDHKKFKGAFEASRHPTTFMELVTCDHIVSTTMKALTGATNASVLKDVMSGLTEFCPMASKNLWDTSTALRYFRGQNTIKCMYSDSSGEIIGA